MISTVARVKASKTLGFSAATLALASGISTLALAATRVAERKRDVPGMVLLAAGTVGILFGISNASASLAAPRTWARLSSRLTSGQFGYALGLAGSSVLVSSLTRVSRPSRAGACRGCVRPRCG